jgi:outer membrane protein OmpA-like peptidoglycan-associated protein
MMTNKISHNVPGRLVMLLLAGILAAASVGSASTALAVENPKVNVDFFRPSVHPWDILGVQTSAMSQPWQLSGALWLTYTNDPLRLVDPVDETRIYQMIENQFGGVATLSMGLFRYLDVGLAIPFSYATGEEPVFGSILADATGFHLGDIRLGIKGRLMGCNTPGWGMALAADLTFPTASANGFVGDDGLTFTPTFIVDYRFKAGIVAAANVGYRMRPDTRLVSIDVTDDFLLGAGVVVPVMKNRLDFLGTMEVRTDVSEFFGSKHHNALDLHGAGRLRLGNIAITAGGGGGMLKGYGSANMRGFASVAWMPPLEDVCVRDRDGDGVVDSQDECPDEPGLAQFAGCPDRDGDGVEDRKDKCLDQPGPVEAEGCPDSDGDGIPDNLDRCPQHAGPAEFNGCPDTDADGIPDHEDNCPEEAGPVETRGCPDRDGDGVPDKADLCPDIAGPVKTRGCPDRDGDGVMDDDDKCPDVPGVKEYDGCPAPADTMKEISEIEVKIFFEFNSDRLTKGSMKELDQLAKLLRENKAVRVRIEGHTDSRGDPDYNQKLSERRAQSVFKYLISRKVSPGNLEWIGFGASRPVADNETDDGRAKNRRVEFIIIR